MDELAHDERMRRLQRLAYGAVASDAERAAAVAELEALRRGREAGPGPGAGPGEGEGAGEPDDEQADDASQPDAAPPRSAHSEPTLAPRPGAAPGNPPQTAHRFKWAIAAGAAALVGGIAVGWQVGLRQHELSSDHQVLIGAPDLELTVGTVTPVPIDAAPAARVFDRPAVPADTPPGLDRDDLLADSYRLLSTRSDSVRIYAARTVDAANVCIVIALPAVDTPSDGVVAGGSGSACTSDGRFPGEGLTIGFSGQGRGAIRAVWSLDGSVSVSPAASSATTEATEPDAPAEDDVSEPDAAD